MTDFEAQRQALRQQIQDLNKQERIGRARDNRAQARAAMSPEQAKAQTDADALTARAFVSDDAKAWLAAMADRRPVVHDEIQEAIARTQGANAAKSSA